jgi:hypothetical protein
VIHLDKTLCRPMGELVSLNVRDAIPSYRHNRKGGLGDVV